MRINRFVSAVALSLAAAACGQGDSDNVMASGANGLSPAQVDAALGPEASNTTENEAETSNAADSASPYRPLNVSGTPPAARTADDEPADGGPDSTIRDTSSSEQ